MTLSVEDFLLSIQKLILGNDLNTTYKLALVLAVTNKAGEIPFVNHPDSEVFEISYRELALEFFPHLLATSQSLSASRQEFC